MSELPYTFEEYVHARGLVHMNSHGAGAARVAFFSLARKEASVIFSTDEWCRLLVADIDVLEKRHAFAKLSALKPKLPKVAGQKRTRQEEPIEDIPALKKAKATNTTIVKAGNKPRSKYRPPGASRGVQIPILNGHELPVNAVQAEKVASLRRELLEHRLKRVKKEIVPDAYLLPEFFTIEDGDDEAVRCVCGCIENDKNEMIQCDSCNVWQHTECMGAAVPKDINDDYSCHQCDPWAHRKLISQLRRDSEIQLL